MIKNLHLLNSALYENRSSVRYIMDQPSTHYTWKAKSKMKFGRPQTDINDSIKIRHLFPPVPSLKLLQRQICHSLQEIELPDCMFGSLPGSNNIINALEHLDGKFFLTIDLKNFFSNITNTQVHQLLMMSFEWEEARILTKLTTYKGSLPQGAPSSPILANLAFADTALQLQNFIKKHKITFTTFLDDLTFSSKTDFKFLVPDLIQILKSNRFYPHHKKIHYRKDFCEITGLIVGKGRIRLPADMRKEALKNLRLEAYALSVEEHYEEHIRRKR